MRHKEIETELYLKQHMQQAKVWSARTFTVVSQSDLAPKDYYYSSPQIHVQANQARQIKGKQPRWAHHPGRIEPWDQIGGPLTDNDM